MTLRTSCRTCGPSMYDHDEVFDVCVGMLIGALVLGFIVFVLMSHETYDAPPGYYYACGGTQVVKVDGEYIKGKSCNVARKE